MTQDLKGEFASISEAVADFAAGKFLIVLDDESRENEGDLIIAASHVTTEKMAFMIRYTSGFVCTATTEQRLRQLALPPMIPNTADNIRPNYCITTDIIEGTTTGISAADRSLTARSLADFSITDPKKFLRPGHMIMLQAAERGVIERGGHTEASVDLCKLANCSPCGVLCELVNDDGTMKRKDDCFSFGKEHGLKVIHIQQLIGHLESNQA